jgi:hypothetical protein
MTWTPPFFTSVPDTVTVSAILSIHHGMLRWKWDVGPVVLGSGILGLLYHLVAPAL